MKRNFNVTEAREKLCQLINKLSHNEDYVEIRQRGKVQAVIIGIKAFTALKQKAETYDESQKEPWQLGGSITYVGDLEAGSRKIARMFERSIVRSAEKLKKNVRLRH